MILGFKKIYLRRSHFSIIIGQKWWISRAIKSNDMTTQLAGNLILIRKNIYCHRGEVKKSPRKIYYAEATKAYEMLASLFNVVDYKRC